jgi:hypothetical protein
MFKYICLYTHVYAYNADEETGIVPNKTIYLKESDLKVWDRAQKELGGESISSIITDCLKKRLKAAKTVDNVEAMKELLAELNAESSLALELHPSWSPIILDANSLDVGYKLHEKGATPDRIMSLIVDRFNFAPDGKFTADAGRQIRARIMAFWDGKRTDQHAVVRNFDILSHLLNLVGKKGFLHTQTGDYEFTFIAVHPAPNLPMSGDDEEIQRAISQSEFTVQFGDGILIDGSNRKVISGFDICRIRGRY